MDYPDDIVMRYLFGELSEAERTELETQYFADPRAFNRLEHFENELIDDYSRGRLSGETRARFERAYLSNSNRRARLKFGEALAARLDRTGPSFVTGAVSRGRSRRRLFQPPWLGSPAFAFATALVLLLLVLGAASLLVQSRRLKAELAQREAMKATQEQEAADLQRQLADEQKRNQELKTELERASNQVTPESKPSTGAATPAFVTLLLTANIVRGAEKDSPPTLTISNGAEQVHVQLTLKDHDHEYQSYQIVLRAIAGPEILNRQDLKPRINKSGATFNLELPASKFTSGDYMLTLRGASQRGEFEDVSKSLFRVEKK